MRGQRQAVLNWFKENRTLTSMEAFEHLGVTRLAAVVHDFRRMGHDIETHIIVGKNRFGEHCEYAEYFYIGKENQ